MEGKIRFFAALLLVLAVVAICTYWFVKTKPEAVVKLQVPSATATGLTFQVPIRMDITKASNAAELYLSFPKELVEVSSIDQTGSIFELWIKDYPHFSNETGEIALAGGRPKPGFSGQNLLVATVSFTAKKAGHGQLTIDSSRSRILANDGAGTALRASFTAKNLVIKP